MKVRGFGLGRSVAVRRGEVMLRRARLSFSNPGHSPRKQLELGMNALRYCTYFYYLKSDFLNISLNSSGFSF